MNQNISQNSLNEALAAFTREIGVAEVSAEISTVGNRDFIKFQVGRESPLYDNALFSVQKNLSDWNIYKGALGVTANTSKNFPESVEARALLTLLSRSTREVSQGAPLAAYKVPYVPFQQREDHTLAQPAAHIVRGRRGVGKSTLIRRAVDLLKETHATVAVIDMQSYSTLPKDELLSELFFDICTSLASSGDKVAERAGIPAVSGSLKNVATQIIRSR